MRIKLQNRPTKYHETRIIERFLFQPLRLKDEIRWLEKAKIKQKAMREVHYAPGFGAVRGKLKWYDEKFVD